MIRETNLKKILIQSVANIYQSLKVNIKSKLSNMKLTNSMLREYKPQNLLKNYWKIESYQIMLGKVKNYGKLWIN